MNEPIKYCPGCGEEKPLTEFHKNICRKDGHHSRCKACRVAEGASYTARNRDRIRKYAHKYHMKNRDRIREYNREYSKGKCCVDRKYLADLELKVALYLGDKSFLASLIRDAKLWREHIKEEKARVNKLQSEMNSWPKPQSPQLRV